MAETVSILFKVSDNGGFKKVDVDAESLRNAVQHVKEETDRLNNSIVNQSQASQAFGVIGDEVQLAGAQRKWSFAMRPVLMDQCANQEQTFQAMTPPIKRSTIVGGSSKWKKN